MREGRSIRSARSSAPFAWATVAGWAAVLLLCASTGRAAPGPSPSPEPPSTASLVPELSTRFRFIERYGAEGEKLRPEVIGQYRVALRETNKRLVERPQGAPERSEVSFQTIYTERPARVMGDRDVTDAIRRYDAFRVVPDRSKPSDPRPLEGLTLWYRPKPHDNPQIVCLTPNRSLREIEYAIAARQIFLPDLRGLLPTLPIRIGDSWKIPRPATQVLLGDRSVRGEGLTGKLAEVRRGEKGLRWVAMIGVTGRAVLAMTGDTVVNAQILFTFTPPDPALARKEDEGTVDAWGANTEVRMALTATAALTPRPDERLRQVVTRELILERQLANGAAPLSVPSPPPEPNEANSWLTYEDAAGRFHFRFPQELQQPPPAQRPEDGSIELVDRWPVPRDVVALQFQPATGKPDVDKPLRDPEFYRKGLTERWRQERLDVIPGQSGWLPEAEWAGAKMKVYRFEAVIKATGRDDRRPKRTYFEQYLALFGRDDTLAVSVQTEQDPPRTVRKQVEEVLKTFRLGPAKP